MVLIKLAPTIAGKKKKKKKNDTTGQMKSFHHILDLFLHIIENGAEREGRERRDIVRRFTFLYRNEAFVRSLFTAFTSSIMNSGPLPMSRSC